MVSPKSETLSALSTDAGTGMLTVHDVAVEESLDGVEVVCPEMTLEKAGSMVCNATYLLTQVSLEQRRSAAEELSSVAYRSRSVLAIFRTTTLDTA